MKKIAFTLLISAVLLSACGKSGSDHSMHEGTNSTNNTKDHTDMEHGARQSANNNVDPSKVQATWKLSAEKPQAKQNATISLHVTTRFPEGGEYKLVADFIPTGMGAATKTTWVTAQGEPRQAAAIQPDSDLTKTVGDKEITLSFDQLTAGKELNLNFNMKNATSKKPITNLQPYLGAIGHVVIMSADTE